MKEIQNTQARVEADEVDHFEWSHRVVQTELQGLVNVSRA